MEFDWGASWGCGLPLITVTTAVHAFGIVVIYRGLQRSGHLSIDSERYSRHPIARSAVIIGVVGLLLSMLAGVEAAIWAAAYLVLGAIDSYRDAMLYSVNSFTTRGASGLMLNGGWRLMGALEAANGMLLFGISTAFVFTVIQRIMTLIDRR